MLNYNFIDLPTLFAGNYWDLLRFIDWNLQIVC